jgi:hypothetical protein
MDGRFDLFGLHVHFAVGLFFCFFRLGAPDRQFGL